MFVVLFLPAHGFIVPAEFSVPASALPGRAWKFLQRALSARDKSFAPKHIMPAPVRAFAKTSGSLPEILTWRPAAFAADHRLLSPSLTVVSRIGGCQHPAHLEYLFA
jgi:hypothetical protein